MKFMQSVQEIYQVQIRPLGEDDKLQIAALIFEEVMQTRKERHLSTEEKKPARQWLQQFTGSVKSGNRNGSSNEQIDKDLAMEYLNRHEDED